MKQKFWHLLFFICSFYLNCSAQQITTVDWLTFEQLEDSLAQTPKKIFIDFYTDWCRYCRKMDKAVFTQSKVIQLLNEDYYAIRFDAETEEAVIFSGRTFINNQIGKTRTPLHQIAQLLALQKGQFTAPTLVILDADFRVKKRYFEYLSGRELLNALQ